ncbi:MAG: PTS sugar transporter subunit IIA [Anaeromyxobacteraceae bacterium]
MIGVVLAAHGRLAEELLRALEQICGPCDNFRAMTLSVSSAIGDARNVLDSAIREADQGDGVLVLTDMFGGSPSNIALTFLGERVEVVTGVNLPMLLKAATSRGAEVRLGTLADLVASEGRKSIGRASDFLRPAPKARGAPA